MLEIESPRHVVKRILLVEEEDEAGVTEKIVLHQLLVNGNRLVFQVTLQTIYWKLV